MKELKKYLGKHGLSQTEFARRLMISRGHLNNIINGNLKCCEHLAMKIQKETKGAIKFEDIMKFVKENVGRLDR